MSPNEARKLDDYDVDDDDDDDDEDNDDDDDMGSGDRMAVASQITKGGRSRVKANIARSILF